MVLGAVFYPFRPYNLNTDVQTIKHAIKKTNNYILNYKLSQFVMLIITINNANSFICHVYGLIVTNEFFFDPSGVSQQVNGFKAPEDSPDQPFDESRTNKSYYPLLTIKL